MSEKFKRIAKSAYVYARVDYNYLIENPCPIHQVCPAAPPLLGVVGPGRAAGLPEINGPTSERARTEGRVEVTEAGLKGRERGHCGQEWRKCRKVVQPRVVLQSPEFQNSRRDVGDGRASMHAWVD